MNRTISILGCGWLGKQLGASLVGDGYEVMGSTTRMENAAALSNAGIVPFVFDVGNISNDDRPFFHADVVIISLPQRLRANKGEEYIQQIGEVMKHVRTADASKIIMFSTTSVYPDLNRVVTEEDADPSHPVLKAERLVQQSGMPTTIVRFSGLYGSGREPGKFLAGRENVPGASNPVNLIHGDDCIGIIRRIIDVNAWGHVLSACADDHPSKKDFYSKAAVALGLKPPVFSDVVADYKIVSNAYLKAVLNYRMIHRLD